MTTNVENQLISGVDILFSYYPNSGWSNKDRYFQFEIIEKEETVEVNDEDVKKLNSIGWFKDKEFTNNNWVHPV